MPISKPAVWLFLFSALLLSATLSLRVMAGSEIPPPQLLHVRYPSPQAERLRNRNGYFVELVTLAIEKAGYSPDLEPVNRSIASTARNIRFLNSGQFDVSWLHTDRHKEKLLHPIRIPIFKGMIGWRLLLAREEVLPELHTVRDLSDLKPYVFGLGSGWPDVKIMRESGLLLKTSSVAADIPLLMRHGKVDLFSRAVIEVWDELEAYGGKGIALDSSLVLHYPSATYLFVAKHNVALASILEEGLSKSLQDGSFDQLFKRYFESTLIRAQLNERQIINFENPDLPTETPLNDKRLWIQPSDFQQPSPINKNLVQ